MVKLTARTGNRSNERLKLTSNALPSFRYEEGYTISASDLGKLGVKIELNHQHDTGVAIILPPGKVGEFGRWLLETLEQDSNGLPKQLYGILERLSSQRGLKPTLQRGDKKKIKDALRVLKRQSSKEKIKAQFLRPVSTKAI